MFNIRSIQESLKSKKPNMDNSLAIRLHRGLSWCKAAQTYQGDHDIRFIGYWVAFSACFSAPDNHHVKLGERASFVQFVDKLIQRDTKHYIASVLWDKYPNAVRGLLDNPYVFRAFWASQGQASGDWKSELMRESRRVNRYVKDRDVAKILALVLDRLSVLRNQIVYGGATYQSQVNRAQLIDGADMLADLVPAIICVMLEASKSDWGEIFYPVIESTATPRTEPV